MVSVFFNKTDKYELVNECAKEIDYLILMKQPLLRKFYTELDLNYQIDSTKYSILLLNVVSYIF